MTTKTKDSGAVQPTSSGVPIQALTMSIPIAIFCIAALSIALTGAVEMGLSQRETASLVIALYGIPGVLGLVMTLIFRQPLLLAWNTSMIIFLASLSARFSYAEMIGATMVAGLVLALLGAFGLTSVLARLLPAPIVYGLLAGLVMPYVVNAFTESGRDIALVGVTILVFFVARRMLPPRISPLLPALLAGIVIAGATGQARLPPDGLSLPTPVLTLPAFSLNAILTISPIVLVVMAIQGNLAAIIYLRSQGFDPPERWMNIVSGGAATIGSVLGPIPAGMASLLTPFTAGPDAGPHHQRHWSVYASAPLLVLIALAGSLAADLPTIIPLTLLLTVAGLGLSGVLAQALMEVTRGPLRLGPLFAFVVASSELTLFSLGPVFWALVIGMAVSLLLESHELSASRATV